MQILKFSKDFFKKMEKERVRQEDLHGAENRWKSIEGFCSILGEEYGEVCKAINEADMDNLEEEVVQVATVALALYQRIQTLKMRGEPDGKVRREM